MASAATLRSAVLDQDYPLTDVQIEQYQRDGFIALPDVVTGDDLQALRDAVAGAVEAEHTAGVVPDQGAVEGVYAQIFIQKVNLWRRHEAVRPFVLSRRFANIAARLEGRPMRIWHDQALFKEPQTGSRTPWHQDAPYWPHDNRLHATTIWIALKDATIHNGCMSFIPGTQTLDGLPGVRLGVPDDLFEWAPQYKGVKGQVRELKAGACTFHNGLTFHYAGPNKSDHMREAFAILYMPDGTGYDGKDHIVTDPLKLTPGEPLAGEMFPLVSDVHRDRST